MGLFVNFWTKISKLSLPFRGVKNSVLCESITEPSAVAIKIQHTVSYLEQHLFLYWTWFKFEPHLSQCCTTHPGYLTLILQPLFLFLRILLHYNLASTPVIKLLFLYFQLRNTHQVSAPAVLHLNKKLLYASSFLKDKSILQTTYQERLQPLRIYFKNYKLLPHDRFSKNNQLACRKRTLDYLQFDMM